MSGITKLMQLGLKKAPWGETQIVALEKAIARARTSDKIFVNEALQFENKTQAEAYLKHLKTKYGEK